MKTITIAALLIGEFVLFGFRAHTSKIQTEEGIHFFTGTWQQALEKIREMKWK